MHWYPFRPSGNDPALIASVAPVLSRRTFLAGAATTAGAAALAGYGCSTSKASKASPGPSVSASPAPTTIRQRAGDRPDPTKAEGTDLLPQIEHIVVVMMENHSYDNYFGMLDRGDGFERDSSGRPLNSNKDASGAEVRAFHMANTCQLPKQPSQAWNATHVQWNGGAMDGFVRSDSGPVAMGYWTEEDIPFYYGLGRTFTLCDRWFGSCMAQTFPNRRFLLAATARGNISTDLNTITDFQPPNGTIMELLDKHGASWRDYYSSLPTTGLFLPVVQANPDKVVRIEQFYADAAAGKLPLFSLVEPDFNRSSEENSDDITLGEAFTASVLDAVMRGPGWAKTLLVWSYDEHGGYYDHVPPPVAVAPDSVPPRIGPGDQPGDYARYGFRVPAVVVSPYSRRDYVSHVVHDHTSILKLVQRKLNLPALTDRDAAADDLLDCVDLGSAPAFLTPPVLPTPKNGSGRPLCSSPGPVPNPVG